MSLDATLWAWKQNIKPSQKLVLLSLADRCGEEFTAYPSQKRLEKDTGLNIKTIKSTLSKLIELGLIVDTGQRKGATNSVKIYRLLVNEAREDSPKTGQHKNEASPLFPSSKPKNGPTKLAQNRAIESTIIEPLKETCNLHEDFETIWKGLYKFKKDIEGNIGRKDQAKEKFKRIFSKLKKPDYDLELEKLKEDLRLKIKISFDKKEKGDNFDPFKNQHFVNYLTSKIWQQ